MRRFAVSNWWLRRGWAARRPAWTPASWAGVARWLDPALNRCWQDAARATPCVAGDPVRKADGVPPTTAAFDAPSDAERPLLLNPAGKYLLRLDGTASNLTTPAWTSAGAWTFGVAVRPRALAASQILAGNVLGVGQINLFQRYILIRSDANRTWLSPNNTVTDTTGPHVLVVEWDGAGGLTVEWDGVAVAPGSNGLTAAEAWTLRGVGCNMGGGTAAHDLYAMAWGAGTGVRVSLRKWLAARCGVSL